MKSNLLRTFFEWALITSVLMSVGFFAWYWMKSREARVSESRLAAVTQQYQRNQFVVDKLFRDCNEYANTNPDLARLLSSLSTPPPSPAKPKSATR